MRRVYLIILLSVIFIVGCNDKNEIEGLWLVKSVVVDGKEITPNARWMRFNSDLTQESGNGWMQHSIGTWKLNSNELSIMNINGVDDSNEPFKIEIDNNVMVWNRVEEGAVVKVNLEKGLKLPVTYGDQLLGLWKLDNVEGEGKYFSSIKDSSNYLFIRWDRRFIIGSNKGKMHGVYNVHGHKPELELIPYSEKIKRSYWEIKFQEKSILLSLLNSDSLVTRTFKRIHEFPK